MSISPSYRHLIALFFFWGWDSSLKAESDPLHFSADKQIWDRNANQVELIGHAHVSQPKETLLADYMKIDLNTSSILASGHCIYTSDDLSFWSEKVQFNMKKRIGTIFEGRITNNNFTLRGKVIERLSSTHFKAQDGSYTTCVDCSPSWNLKASDLDFEVEGYAKVSGGGIYVKDQPILWFPYMILPVKTKRQTGFLFPAIVPFNQLTGTGVVLPFFWAIDQNADMTLGGGTYTNLGNRAEWEGRIVFSERSRAEATAFYIGDKTTPFYRGNKVKTGKNRWALNVAQLQELPWNFEERFEAHETSDQFYPFQFQSDFPAGIGSEAYLTSTLSLSQTNPISHSFLSFQRYRNTIYVIPDKQPNADVSIDPTTVQAFPHFEFNLNEQPILRSPILGGFSFKAFNFTRSEPRFYDSEDLTSSDTQEFRPGIDPIRAAKRLSLSSKASYQYRIADTVLINPTATYKVYHYKFPGNIPSLNRGYLLIQTRASTQFEKVTIHKDLGEENRLKHLIRPEITYSIMPFIHEPSSHPFLEQMSYAARGGIVGEQKAQRYGSSGFNFDNEDIIPYSFKQSNSNNANFFNPLGNSISYGFNTQFITRSSVEKSLGKRDSKIIDFSAGQTLDLIEVYKPLNPNSRKIFGRLYSTLNLNLPKLQSLTNYYYYPQTVIPEQSHHTVSTELTYFLETSLHQGIYTFQRSLGLNYVFNEITVPTNFLRAEVKFSINDYWMPYASASYTFAPPKPDFQDFSIGLTLQSPSRCWKFSGEFKYTLSQGYGFFYDFRLNLEGDRYFGVTDIIKEVGS